MTILSTSAQFDPKGWLIDETISHHPSPFFNQRPAGQAIDLCVLHNISLPPRIWGSEYVDDLFMGRLKHYQGTDPFLHSIKTLEVSAHFFIARDGGIRQYVSIYDRAWHAGVSQFQGRDNCNDFSIGIELNGADDLPYAFAQYESLARLIVLLMRTLPALTKERMTTHSAIAPERKTDPGVAFFHPYLHERLEDICR